MRREWRAQGWIVLVHEQLAADGDVAVVWQLGDIVRSRRDIVGPVGGIVAVDVAGRVALVLVERVERVGGRHGRRGVQSALRRARVEASQMRGVARRGRGRGATAEVRGVGVVPGRLRRGAGGAGVVVGPRPQIGLVSGTVVVE